MAILKTDHFKNYLQLWSQEVVDIARENLRAAGKGGGDLDKSLDARIEVQGDDIIAVQFLMEDYGTFVDKGVKGAGGTIKTGEHKGSWGGRRWYINFQGKREDSPYQFGTGSGQKGGMTKGIASFIRKKNINRDSVTGKFIPAKSIAIAIMKTLWVKGIHGVSFFQDSLMLGMSEFRLGMGEEIKADLIDTLVTFPNITRA